MQVWGPKSAGTLPYTMRHMVVYEVAVPSVDPTQGTRMIVA